MNINSVLVEYDALFGKHSLTDIETFLTQKISEAVEEKDDAAIITLLNELIGLCRDTSQKDKAISYSEQLKKLMLQMNLEGTPEYATSMQNIANVYRAFGLLDEAESAFYTIESTYEVYLDKNDYLWASLYNNWGLLYQEKCEFDKSVTMLERALELIVNIPNSDIKIAITKTNLANSLMANPKEEMANKAYSYLKDAIAIFVSGGERDFHYGAAVVAMGDYYAHIEEWLKAKEYYQKGLVEILVHTGKTEFYQRVKEKYQYANMKISKRYKSGNNLKNSQEFYIQYGKEMIHNNFPGYESRIAVGLVGEGSDCYGFDDDISKDHDYGVGFCMWLTDKDMSTIGESLKKSYEELISKYYQQDFKTSRLSDRRGVFVIDEFFKDYEDEYKLSEMVNGDIFVDDLGVVTQIRRKLLEYYPEAFWRKKLANLIHEFSQYGQSNYARMMARNDYLTAGICVNKAIESALDIGYVLSKRYAPYYKWKRRGLEDITDMQDIVWICEELSKVACQKAAWENTTYSSSSINYDDRCVVLIETLAKVILEKMSDKGIVKGNDPFLLNYIGQILEGENTLIDKIIELEWEQFDKVENEGGRASCQNDYVTFEIMRRSQYMTWNKELLESYYNDLKTASSNGWNLIMEKYARMMKTTSPDKYKELEAKLPVRSEKREAITEEIVKIQVAWMEEFASKYPKMAGNARSIHTYEDNEFNTSYETYLRGEIGTYGEETFVLYGRFITEMLSNDKNLSYETMKNTAKLYGYESIEAAEQRLN